MKATATVLVILLAATAAFGQTEGTADERRDYSKDTMMRLTADIPQRPEHEPRLVFHVGAVDFRALGTRWRFNFLPFMMPLSGTRLDVTQEWPDPFALTHTQIATPPRAFTTRRQMNAELRRIDRVTKKPKATVKVTTE